MLSRLSTLLILAILATIHASNNLSEEDSDYYGYDERVIGGDEAEIANFTVSLQYGGRHYCVGALIAQKWALTAAHCSPYAGDDVAYGDIDYSQGERKRVRRVYVHPDFAVATYEYDFALLELNEDFPPDSVFAGAPMETELYEDANATVYGWGTTSSTMDFDDLQFVTLPTLTNSACNNAYGGIATIYDTHICAGDVDVSGVGPCQSDGGAPLVDAADNTTLIGLWSFSRGCGQLGYPAVFARVGEVVAWVNETCASCWTT